MSSTKIIRRGGGSAPDVRPKTSFWRGRWKRKPATVRSHPTYRETDEWLRHLGVSEEDIEASKERVRQEHEMPVRCRRMRSIAQVSLRRVRMPLRLPSGPAFSTRCRKMVSDLRAGHPFRPSLRIKGVQGHPGVFEMTWAPDGRATFHYGAPSAPRRKRILCGGASATMPF